MISVIIPAYNKKEALVETLCALMKQTIPLSEYEIIVVDDGSKDGTSAWLEKQSLAHPVRTISQNNRGAGTARNQGAGQATGDVLLFLDADIIPSPGLLAAHLDAHRIHEHCLVQGRVRLWEKVSCGAAYRIYTQVYDLGEQEHLLPYQFGLTQNLSIRADEFSRLGGFNGKLIWGEDTEFNYRALQSGCTLLYKPDALGYHNHPLELDQLCDKVRRDHCRLVPLFKIYPQIAHDLAYLNDKLPVNWGEDRLGLVERKLIVQMLAAGLARRVFYEVCAQLEELWPGSALLDFFLWRLLAGYQWLGLREGEREYGWKPSK